MRTLVLRSAKGICFNCGLTKLTPFTACQTCGSKPKYKDDYVLSIACSEILSSPAQLLRYSQELRQKKELSVPAEVLAEAREASFRMHNPKVAAVLNADPLWARGDYLPIYANHPDGNYNSWERKYSQPIEKPTGFRSSLKTTALHQSSFALLGATIHHSRAHIVALEEEKSLVLDHSICQRAASDLTNLRARLSAEIAWLPAVSPNKASKLLQTLLEDPLSIPEETGLPVLAHLNLLAAVLDAIDDQGQTDNLAEVILQVAYFSSLIQKIADLVERLDAEEILEEINADRVVSGFPQVQTRSRIEPELTERKRYYRKAIRDALNRLPPAKLVQTMTHMVEIATQGGDSQAPTLIDDLVDTYEVETQAFLETEAENVKSLIKTIRSAANAGEAAVKTNIDKLCVVTRNWDAIAQPIQLSAKARGIDHEASRGLAYEIRSVAIDLFNEHDMLVQSQRLTHLLQELFAEVPEISEKVAQDADALSEILTDRKSAKNAKEGWAREITYSVEIGLLFKETLSISPERVSWAWQSFPLESISRVRWGGTRNSVNGIPTGTTYTVAFGDGRSEAAVNLKDEAIFSTFIGKLWRAVGVRLLTEMLEALKAGRDQRFGDLLVHDDGVTLIRHKFFGSSEHIRLAWGQIRIWNADGSFCVGSKEDRKLNVTLPYLQVANTHVVEQAIRISFKKPGVRRLSDLLH